MGYYTSYNLTLQKIRIDEETGRVEYLKEKIHPNTLKKIDRMLSVDSPLESEGDNTWCCNDKWYSPDPEILLGKISKACPNILFTLKAHGEDEDDIWVEYFLNGQFQSGIARIIFDQFSPQKLSSPKEWADDRYSKYLWYQEAYM